MVATAINNKELYETAFAAFVPALDDAVDNIPFYRAWHGLKAVLVAHGHADPFTAPIDAHGICCWAKSGLWEDVLKVLPMHTPKKPVHEVTVRCFYKSEPSLPTEKDAKCIFDTEYKARFPANRLNCKHAHEQWAKLADAARDIAMKDYHGRLLEYRKALAQHEARERADEAVHQEKVAAYEKQMALIEALTNE